MNNEVKLRSKEKKYRGLLIEDLKKLTTKEVANYLSSRSKRTVLRNTQDVEKFVKRCEDKLNRKKRIRTHLRDMIIVPKLVGMTIAVYNGKVFENVNISIEMIGHRLGEFALTRKRVAHTGAGVGATRGSRVAKK
jgi:small subunit ribosomal protein S19